MEPLAIIGMSSRFPQEGDSNENFWKLLMKGKSAMTPFPKNRFNAEGHHHPDVEHGGTFHVKGGHFMQGDPAEFDHQFFNITKSEVLCLDPQQRLLMENVYQALENAGVTMDKVTGSNTSVFSSGFNHDYLQLLNSDPEIKLKYKPMGTSNSILSGRISWFFDLKGPSLTVDTACSSSMVAFHLGAQSLRDNESDMTLICGVNVFTYPVDWYGMGHHGFLAGDGKSYSFDHRASGYSRGEGVATVVVKRLSTALRDGDTIRAVVRSTGLNQDGRTPGITLPSAVAQESMIRSVYARANLDLKQTGYIEAHATGTGAGDPIEARAIASTFATSDREVPLVVGAVKSVVGHTEGASGLAGIIKTVMILESGIIPPNANFEKANPKIPIDKWKLKLPLEPMVWPSPGLRQASINSFGFSGTNGHVVLQDAYHYFQQKSITGHHRTVAEPSLPKELPDTNGTGNHRNGISEEMAENIQNGYSNESGISHENGQTNGGGVSQNGTSDQNETTHSLEPKTNGHSNGHSTPDAPPFLFCVSAFDEAGVQRNMQALAEYCVPTGNTSDDQTRLSDLAYTLAVKRSSFTWRSNRIASSLEELKTNLSQESGVVKPFRARGVPDIGFVFTGQGAQWHAMGRELLVYETFNKSLQDASNYMQSLGSSWSLYDELQRSKSDSKIHTPQLAHPSCTAIQVAIVDLLTSWGLRPARVVGHSSGEIAAAYCAGKITRHSAWKVAYHRGQVSSKASSSGAMLAVGLTADKLQSYLAETQLEGKLTVACYNSPKNHTVSGNASDIETLRQALDKESVFARMLKVRTAYHSPHMQVVADEYASLLADLEPVMEGTPTAEMYSSVTGSRMNGDLSSNYWVENLVSPVRFSEALSKMATESAKGGLRVNSRNNAIQEIVEIGPHSALRSAIKESLGAQSGESAIGYHAVLDRNNPGVATLLTSIGTLHSHGSLLSIEKVNLEAYKTRGCKQPTMLVDLPPYLFNHAQTIWYESRLSRNYRMRKYPRHDLFGAPVPDWNPDEPAWRNFVRISEQPWLRDHVVTGSIVYPGVGYIIMAIEASKQIVNPDMKLLGFKLKDIAIKTALIVPDDKDGIEVKFAMSAMDESSLANSKTWRQWRVLSYNPTSDSWVEHCTGYISTQYETEARTLDDGLEERFEVAESKKALQEGILRCTTPATVSYDSLDAIGLHFGPLFQNMSDVKVNKGKGEVVATLTVPDVAKVMPKNFAHPHMIHPSTLDSMMHLFIAAVQDVTERSNLDAPMVPTFIKEVRISADIISTAGHKYQGLGISEQTGFQRFHSDITIWDKENQTEAIAVRGWSTKSLGSQISTSEMKKLCHVVDWKPDLDLVPQPKFTNISLSSQQEDDKYRAYVKKLQIASMLLITDALDELEKNPVKGLEGHFAKYYDWCLEQRKNLKDGILPHIQYADWKFYDDRKDLKAELYEEMSRINADGQLLLRMGTNLVQVLKREVDPLHLMFGQDNILNELYRDMVESGDLPTLLRAYLGLVHHNSTNLNILEIGAGTGSLTSPILESLCPSAVGEDATGDSAIYRYTYTDVSSAFFEKAKDKFKRWRAVLDFKTFNIENDVSTQGLEAGKYDFIFAGNVIHATADLTKVLSNLRTLLKPSGKLIMHEGVRQDFLWLPLAFGQLPGWWLSVEPNRKWCPSITESEWDEVLRKAGFAGVSTILQDRELADIRGQSIMVSKNMPEPLSEPPQNIWILAPDVSDELAIALQDMIATDFGLANCFISTLHELVGKTLINDICISLVDLDSAILSEIQQEQYDAVKHILSTSDGVLWLTGDFTKKPEHHMINGVIRTVRWERDLDSPNLITLAVAEPRPDKAPLLESIMAVFKQQFTNTVADDSKNTEYLLQDGQLLTNRLLHANTVNEFVHFSFAEGIPQPKPFNEAGRPIMLDTASPGSLSALHFATDPVWSRPLKANEVEVEIKAVGLNFRDVLIAMGEHVAACLGNEAAGFVSRIGSEVTNVQVGDRVVYMNGLVDGGCLKTFGRQVADAVVKLPDSVSFEDAASLPCVYSTAIHGLYDIAQLTKGESVLIHAAAGGVGQAAIQLAQLVGAEVYATVSTEAKRELLVREYGLKKEHIFSSRDLSFAKGIMRVTNNRGIDVVLNSLAGDLLRASWDILAPFGRFIEIGKRDAQASGRIELNPLLRQTVMASVDLTTIMHYKPKKLGQLIERSVELFAARQVRLASPTRVMDYTQIEEAFRSLQSGRGMGKVVFKPNVTDVVPIMPEKPAPLQFDANATYVLAGGLGGLGRSIARWMASRGAKNLVFVSRSGKASKGAQELAEDLEVAGCHAHIFACDVCDKDALKTVLSEVASTLPPIKGCIQGSMVLKDAMFENMTFDNFQAAVGPKVKGSWNLHEVLPRNLDFFLLLSSATGILGNRSQANYAAGNTYQDALAIHRRSLGLRATSIDLGSILSVGYVAENKERLGTIPTISSVLEQLREEDVHAILEYHLDPRYDSPSQTVTGLTDASLYKQRRMPVPSYLTMPLFRHLNSESNLGVEASEDDPLLNVGTQLGAATSVEEAVTIASAGIRLKLSKLLAIAMDDIDPGKSISSNGVDSLVATEFRTWLARTLKAEIPMLEIMGSSSLQVFAEAVVTASTLVQFDASEKKQ